MKNQRVFEVAVKEIFPHKGISDYKELRAQAKITFTLTSMQYTAVEWSQLKQLSELLGTEEIGFEGDFEYGYYDDIDLKVMLYCLNVKFPLTVK